MQVETITTRDDLLIRRLVLAPGEAMFWHIDNCHRFSVVVQGEKLGMEYLDTGERVDVDVYPGLADWDAPESRAHRAINLSQIPYEEVVTFYRASADVDPQPVVTSPA